MSTFLTALFLASLSMSVVIVLLLLLNKISANKISAKSRYYMWLIVLIGFIIPFRPDIPVPFVPLQIPTTFHVVVDMHSAGGERIQNETRQISSLGSAVITDALPAVPDARKPSVSYSLVLFGIWVIGVLAILVFHLLSYGKFVSAIRGSGVEAKDSILSIMQAVQADMGLQGKKITVKTCMYVSSPMLIGFFSPIILLPEREIFSDELDNIFRHELTHYRRKDLWINMLILFVSAIHWFNPFVHLMAKTIRTDCEIVCDETVVAGSDTNERKCYGETIIGFIEMNNIKTPVLSVLSTYFYGGSKAIRKRLHAIMDTNRKSKKLAVLCVIAVIMAIIISSSVFATSAASINIHSNDTKITARQALAIALGFIPTGEVESFELKKDGGLANYQIVVLDGVDRYVLLVNVASGEIESFSKDIPPAHTFLSAHTIQPYSVVTIDLTGDHQLGNVIITADEAQTIALERVGSGIVVEVELEQTKSQGLVYEVEVVNGQMEYEVKINATTGVIIKVDSKYKITSWLP